MNTLLMIGLTVVVLAMDPTVSGSTDSVALVGVDIIVRADDITCEIIPAKDEFKVGDQPEFDIVLQNNSSQSFYLLYGVDGSTRRARYPHVELNIEGPDSGIVVTALAHCGNLNQLRRRDFSSLEPGGRFRPFAWGAWPTWISHGRFDKPGTYTVTFRYSTDEPDIREWLGTYIGMSTWGTVPRVPWFVSDWIGSVPRIELVESITVQVTE